MGEDIITITDQEVNYPAIPEREGYLGSWDKVEFKNRNQKVYVQYRIVYTFYIDYQDYDENGQEIY